MSGCDSKLRILRVVSSHYPMLCRFLSQLYDAIRSHKIIDGIDHALKAGVVAVKYLRIRHTECRDILSLIQ